MSSSVGANFMLILLLLLLVVVGGEAAPNPVTATTEAEAFTTVFKKWGIASMVRWNSTDDPCSGVALGGTVSIDDTDYDPFIKCDCSPTTCHIIALKVYALDVVGEIPDELWNLTFLTSLNLGQNYLTGSVSPSIMNLKKMQYLTFGINALSGSLPKELGQLTELKSLGIGTNNFSGSLPPEMGSILGLQQIYMDSSGVSGKIPSTFANLVNLQVVWASDTELTGSIPDFIGNWTQLTDLRLDGNSFVGSIPHSFSSLTALTTLRIGGLQNGSSSLAFITNLKSLATLVLRNIEFLDSIPSAVGGLTSLNYLDMSFSNIKGTIPESLFSQGSLNYLFLGNNQLTGSLPPMKSPSLINMLIKHDVEKHTLPYDLTTLKHVNINSLDVSYNELSGSIPSWATGSNLQLNLVANNFTDTSTSSLPSRLKCLQHGFPCNRDPPRYSSFAVKCGGPQITSSDGTIFERENERVGPSTYYVADTDRWAVSNAGYFLFSSNASYTAYSTRQFSNTLDSEMFQTARLSPGSLRYYGLGLENGYYTVALQFAELSIKNGRTWRSLGRRVFDIYIQGRLALKNFDIRKEAGGHSFSVVKKNFTAQVTANVFEVHLFWAGKGTCCVPTQGTYGPSISAISLTPNFHPKVSNEPPSPPKKDPHGLVLELVLPFGCLCLLFVSACCIIRKSRRLQATRDEELFGVEYKPYIFSYSTLKSATDDFNASHKLGEGGFGPVYKGTLNDGRAVAVKQLSLKSHQGKGQFVAEIATISAVQQRNLVKLFGCCIEGEKRLLVYEYLENGSLDQVLFGKSDVVLDWTKRFEICTGVAKGLAYLHQESRLKVVHRDVKASNVLLDSKLNPKISDFGLAKLYDEKQTHISTAVAGTFGYLAPEYAMRGHFSEKVDVYSFGVLALEILSGRANFDASLDKEKLYLLDWAWQLYENSLEVELVDEKLSEFNEEEVKRVVSVALLCTQISPAQRPTMSRVVAVLSGDAVVGSVPLKPGYLLDWKLDESSSYTGTSTSSTTVPVARSSQSFQR